MTPTSLPIDRRRLTLGLASLPGLALAGAAPAASAAGPAAHMPPAHTPLARRRIGRFTVTLLSDGYIDLPYGAFTGIEAEALAVGARAAHIGRPAGIRCGFTAWLIDDGERLVLVDAGAAGTVSPTSGWLPGALDSLGIRPSDVDAVVLTHLHVDHVSGLLAGGRAVFGDAEVHADRREVAYFTDTAAAASAPAILASSFEAAAALVDLYPRLQRIDATGRGDGRQIARGLTVVDLAGHTPGHVGLRIEDGDEAMVIVGDMLFHPAIHPARSDVGILFEPDAEAAAGMRRRFFPQAAEAGWLLAATHMPFPGTGRIVPEAGGLAWLPADWDYAA